MTSKFGGGGTPCVVCSKTCYPAEALQFDMKIYHVQCLRCGDCSKKITPAQASAFEDKTFCAACFRKGGYARKQLASPKNTASLRGGGSSKGTMNSRFAGKFGGGGTPCTKCSKTVYPAETIQYDSKPYHPQCFKCEECNKKITPANAAAFEGATYCRPCFKKGGYVKLQADTSRPKNTVRSKKSKGQDSHLAEEKAKADRAKRVAEREAREAKKEAEKLKKEEAARKKREERDARRAAATAEKEAKEAANASPEEPPSDDAEGEDGVSSSYTLDSGGGQRGRFQDSDEEGSDFDEQNIETKRHESHLSYDSEASASDDEVAGLQIQRNSHSERGAGAMTSPMRVEAMSYGAMDKKEGWLYKAGGFRKNKWQQRWAVIHEGHMHYFDSYDEVSEMPRGKPKGSIQLDKANVSGGMHLDRSCCIFITPSKSRKTYILAADNTDDRDMWIQVALGNGAIDGGRTTISSRAQEGYLWKRGGKLKKSWQRRWCRLQKGQFMYYKDQHSSSVSGSFLITGAHLIRHAPGSVEGGSVPAGVAKIYAFSMSPKDSKQARYMIAAESEKDRDTWVTVLLRQGAEMSLTLKVTKSGAPRKVECRISNMDALRVAVGAGASEKILFYDDDFSEYVQLDSVAQLGEKASIKIE